MTLFSDPNGPIESLEWGLFHIDGVAHGEADGSEQGAGKDIRIVGRTVSSWPERKGHRLKRKMITGIAPDSVDILVIGTGVYGRIKCPGKLLRELQTSGLHKVVLLPTVEACATYNRLFHEGRRVALLAHGTC
ncbi:MAG: Mth938-like domain-containing protein [Anaerolineae bacterium]